MHTVFFSIEVPPPGLAPCFFSRKALLLKLFRWPPGNNNNGSRLRLPHFLTEYDTENDTDNEIIIDPLFLGLHFLFEGVPEKFASQAVALHRFCLRMLVLRAPCLQKASTIIIMSIIKNNSDNDGVNDVNQRSQHRQGAIGRCAHVGTSYVSLNCIPLY